MKAILGISAAAVLFGSIVLGYPALACTIGPGDAPTATISPTYAVCVGAPVSFNALGPTDSDLYDGPKPDTVVSFQWDFGDGGTSTDQNPGHTYWTAGDYTVQLTLDDNLPGQPYTGKYYNDSANPVSASLAVVEAASVSGPTQVITGAMADYTVTTNPGGYGSLISWTGGGSPATGIGGKFSTIWFTPGSYTVQAACGTSAAKTIQVTVASPPPANPDPNFPPEGPPNTTCPTPN